MFNDPCPDKQDTCVNELIFLPKKALKILSNLLEDADLSREILFNALFKPV